MYVHVHVHIQYKHIDKDSLAGGVAEVTAGAAEVTEVTAGVAEVTSGMGDLSLFFPLATVAAEARSGRVNGCGLQRKHI